MLWDRKTKLDRLYCSGTTKPQQSLKNMLNSKKFKNIQSQNISNKKSNNNQEEKKNAGINTSKKITNF